MSLDLPHPDTQRTQGLTVQNEKEKAEQEQQWERWERATVFSTQHSVTVTGIGQQTQQICQPESN